MPDIIVSSAVDAFMASSTKTQARQSLDAARSTYPYDAGPRFGIYYNRLETIAGTNSVDAATRYIVDNFDVMVLHYGLDDPLTPGHSEAEQIIAAVVAVRPDFQFYGYIHMGTTILPVLSNAEIAAAIGRWVSMGCHGVFLDECEFAFGTTRPRLNAALDAAHGMTSLYGMPVFAMVNCWDHADLMSDAVHATNNPTGEPAHFVQGDAVHHESIAYNDEQPDYMGANNAALGSTGVIHGWFLKSRSTVTQQLRERFKLRYYAINTYNPANTQAQIDRGFDACSAVGRLLGMDGIGLTVKDFGASGGGVYQCPRFDYPADWDKWVTRSPLISWASSDACGSRRSLRFFHQYGLYWTTGPSSVVRVDNFSRNAAPFTPYADPVLRVPFEKGTVPFLLRLMPYGNSSPSTVVVAVAPVTIDGSGVAWNDGQTSYTPYGSQGVVSVTTENHGWASTLWGAGFSWSLPAYGRAEILIRGSFVATAPGVMTVAWCPLTTGHDVIMTVGSYAEVLQ